MTEPKKSLGQHWLFDPQALADIIEAAEITVEDKILEIGPGLGTLTVHLIDKSKQVIAVELDEILANELAKKYPDVKVITRSILEFDFTKLPAGYKIVANIPYYLTSNLLRVISEASNPPSCAVLLIQKEVAERVAAKPGAMSLLSVTVQYYWQVELDRIVKAELFEPSPKVDSQILILKRRSKPLFDDVNDKGLFRLVKAGFSQRRKTLLNSLSAGLNLSKNDVKTICNSVDIDPNRRAQTLSLEEWHNLYLSLNT